MAKENIVYNLLSSLGINLIHEPAKEELASKYASRLDILNSENGFPNHDPSLAASWEYITIEELNSSFPNLKDSLMDLKNGEEPLMIRVISREDIGLNLTIGSEKYRARFNIDTQNSTLNLVHEAWNNGVWEELTKHDEIEWKVLDPILDFAELLMNKNNNSVNGPSAS